jgi:TPR repeat protein
MEETLRQELLAKTKQALDAEDWDAVARLWEPWVEQGDAEAEYQLAYHYLWCTPHADDDAARDRMIALLEQAAAKDHPEAAWYLAQKRLWSRRRGEVDPEADRQHLRAGHLGSTDAQRELGVMYATGAWSGPQDLAEAARWYRLAAEKGHAESQYDLGFMLLLGEGEPKNTEEGLMWLHRAGEQGEYSAFRLLADCYEKGYYDVPVNADQAALWRGRELEWERLHPPDPSRPYTVEGDLRDSLLGCLWEIEGVTGYTRSSGSQEISVCYDPALITPAQLDERVRATELRAVPRDPA